MSFRQFTLEEARKALPLVTRIATDLHGCVQQLAEIPGGLSFIYGAMKLDEFPGERRTRIESLRGQIEALSDELVEIGVELKGLQPVLVDFRSRRDGAEVCLCWAYGEADIAHWHTVEDGFKGRQPL